MSGPDYDVVVVGGGGAGLAAAVSAAERGATVLVVEAAGRLGGSTAVSGGSFMAAGTRVQAEAGHPGDTAEAFLDHFLTATRWTVEAGVAHAFCERALPTFEWLTSLGVEYPVGGLYRATREPAPRSHRPVGGGASYVRALTGAARARGVEFALGVRVESLVVDGAGRVAGVRSRGEEMTAAAVVLATGGFGANAELARALMPEAAGPSVWSPAVDTCRGDGIGLAAGAGAAIVGGVGDLLLTAGLVRDLEPYQPDWLVLVGGDGGRFVAETAPYSVLVPLARAKGPCWAILDDARLRSATGSTGPWGTGTWSADVLVPALGRGDVVSAPSVAGLAELIGVPAGALAGTLTRYNEDCRRGEDRQFRKGPPGLVAVETAPFHAVRLWPSVLAVTSRGPRIGGDARVLRESDGAAVPGLFAAGEVTGNVIGDHYLGGGHAIGSALIFGRIAGQGAAAEAAAGHGTGHNEGHNEDPAG